MALPSLIPNSDVRPPLIVIGVEQEWAARSLETVLGPEGFAVIRGHSGRNTLELATSVSPDVVLVGLSPSPISTDSMSAEPYGKGGHCQHMCRWC